MVGEKTNIKMKTIVAHGWRENWYWDEDDHGTWLERKIILDEDDHGTWLERKIILDEDDHDTYAEQ